MIRDHLLINVLELHSYYTSSVLNEATPELFISELPAIQAYNEYYLTFNDGYLDMHDVILSIPDDIRKALIKHIFHRKETEDITMEDCSDTPAVTQTQTNENDMTLFKHAAKGHPVNNIFFKVLEHNRKHNPPSFEADENTLTVLGLLTEHDIKSLSRSAILLFIEAIYRSNGDDFSTDDLVKLKLSQCHQALFDEYADTHSMTVARAAKELLFENLTLHSIRMLRRSQIQILLYKHYHETDHEFDFPFRHEMDAMRKHFYSILQPIPPADSPQGPPEDPLQGDSTHKNSMMSSDLNIKKITAGLSNADIVKIPPEQARHLLREYATSRGTTIPENYLSNVQPHQLILQLRSARDILSKEASKPLSQPVSNVQSNQFF